MVTDPQIAERDRADELVRQYLEHDLLSELVADQARRLLERDRPLVALETILEERNRPGARVNESRTGRPSPEHSSAVH